MSENNNGTAELMDKLRNVLNKALIPALLIIIGGYLLIDYATPAEVKINEGDYRDINQTNLFLYAGIGLLMVGLIIGLFNLGLLKSKAIWAIGIVSLAAAGFFLWKSFESIQEYSDHRQMKVKVDTERKQRLVDIRKAMSMFIAEKGRATEDWAELEDFIRNGVTYQVEAVGQIPYREFTRAELDFLGYDKSVAVDQVKWDEQKAWKIATFMPNPASDLKDFRRDTTEIPIIEKLFTSPKAIKQREKSPAEFPFSLDSLRYVPFTGQGDDRDEFKIATGIVKTPIEGGGVDTTFVFRVFEPNPIPEHPGDEIVNDTLSVGSLTTTSTKGSWEK